MMRTNRWAGLSFCALIAFGLLAACGDGGTSPQGLTRTDLVGTYSATTFTTGSGALTANLLSEGAVLTIALNADGTTTGHLLVPGGGNNGSDLDADLAGTFSFDESTGDIAFSQTADTFVRDMTFTASRSGGVVRIEGQQSFSGTTVHVVLQKN